MIEPRQYLARASGVPGVGSARRLEELVHRHPWLKVKVLLRHGERERELELRVLEGLDGGGGRKGSKASTWASASMIQRRKEVVS